MRHVVAVRHNAEAAHRLPFLGGKCESLHGHSWQVEVAAGVDELHDGIAVEFATLKSRLREWIDTNLDHGAMLGADDMLEAVLRSQRCKVFTFGAAHPLTHDLAWPTVENVAVLIGRVAADILTAITDPAAPLSNVPRLRWVRVQETAVNAAEWRP